MSEFGEREDQTVRELSSSPTIMTKRMTRISLSQCGAMFAAIFLIVGLIYTPFAIIFDDHPGATAVRGLGMALLLPVSFAAVGLVKGYILATLFNIAAVWTGGLEYDTIVDVKSD